MRPSTLVACGLIGGTIVASRTSFYIGIDETDTEDSIVVGNPSHDDLHEYSLPLARHRATRDWPPPALLSPSSNTARIIINSSFQVST
jgi:hypothetical protein